MPTSNELRPVRQEATGYRVCQAAVSHDGRDEDPIEGGLAGGLDRGGLSATSGSAEVCGHDRVSGEREPGTAVHRPLGEPEVREGDRQADGHVRGDAVVGDGDHELVGAGTVERGEGDGELVVHDAVLGGGELDDAVVVGERLLGDAGDQEGDEGAFDGDGHVLDGHSGYILFVYSQTAVV